MKRLFMFFAVLAAALVAALPAQANNEGGGGGSVSFISIYRVYTFYDGYWHWINCEWVNYTDGHSEQGRCW